MGRKTEAAVKQLQAARGFTVGNGLDGVVGPKTLAELKKDTPIGKPSTPSPEDKSTPTETTTSRDDGPFTISELMTKVILHPESAAEGDYMAVTGVTVEHLRTTKDNATEANPRAVLAVWPSGPLPGPVGTGVKEVQKALNAKYPDLKLPVDGIYGTSTANAVKRFQKDEGLNPDGRVGTGTIGKLIPK